MCIFAQTALATPGETTLPGDRVISGSTDSPYIPGDQVIPHLDLSDISIDDIIEQTREKIKQAVNGEQELKKVPVSATVSSEKPEPQVVKKAPKPRANQKVANTPQVKKEAPRYYSGMRIIHQNLKYLGVDSHKEMIPLPNGSVALGTMLSGVEAGNAEQDVLIRLDYAFIGPNGSVVEMSGCRMWAGVKGVSDTQRITGTAQEITCMAPSGKPFTQKGLVKILDGTDEYLGAKGETVFYGKDKAFFFDFINGGLSAFGEAMAKFQVKTEVSGNESPIKTENVTGDENKYIAGKTLSGSMGKMMNWFVDYYMALEPKVAAPTGTKVFLGIKGDMEIPADFFGETVPTDYLDGLVKRVNTEKSSWRKQS